MKRRILKPKYGLLWLVFCICALLTLQNYRVVTPASFYNKGFLERLDAEGHAIEKHVGKTDAFLRDRLINEPNIPAASTFDNMEEAETAIRDVLVKRGDLVQAWINANKSNKKSFYYPSDKPMGRVLKQGWDAPRPGNQVRVVLIRDNNYLEGFFILTAYPEIK